MTANMVTTSLQTPPRKHGRKLSKTMPIPVTVELLNVLSPHAIPSSNGKKWFRPSYSTSLLHEVQLEVLTHEEGPEEPILLYCAVDSSSAVCPSWKHIDEHILQQLSVERYESMQFRFLHADTNTLLAQVPAHPSKLTRIASIPDKLPFNAVCIHFSDQSIRITQQLQRRLQVKTFHDGDFSRFQDDVFSELDAVTPIRKQSISSLEDQKGTESSQDYTCTESSDPLLISDLEMEGKRLQEAIQTEQSALNDQVEQLQSSNILQTLRETIASVETQNQEIQEHFSEETKELLRAKFLLSAQSVRLVLQLREIYPIDEPHSIRGLALPQDLNGTEETINAAMGYLAHLTWLLSKYLMVQLRYAINYHSSRSTIRDEEGREYPLFLGRERQPVERGFHFLGRNLDCIGLSKGIDVSSERHTVIKAKLIIEKFEASSRLK